MAACGGESSKEAKISEEQEASKAGKKSKSYKVDTSKSMLYWTGRKQSGKHDGTVKLKKGHLKSEKGELKAGKFVADMTTIKVSDDMDEENYNKLMNHLRSPDFFSVDSFPEASFELTGVKENSKGDTALEGATHQIAGNLTIKGITKNVSEIPAKIEFKDDKLKAVADFSFDRTRWDIMFKSKSILDDLKDGFIYDQVDLRIELMAKKKDMKKGDKDKKDKKKEKEAS